MSFTYRISIQLILAVGLIFFSTFTWAKETALTAILSTLEQVQNLHKMDNNKEYELEARGIKIKGFPDDFLRRRTPTEILKSGLSCGCGDYALAFCFLIESKGFQALYIDTVALNYNSIEGNDSGHTGVAVKDNDSGNWILVDPTWNKIISGDWDPLANFYESPAGQFWIGYKGPLDKYSVKDHAELRAFYAETLKSIPKEIWEQKLLAFDFIIDDSFKTNDGTYYNPNTKTFIERPAIICQKLGIHPSRTVKVIIKPWEKNPGKDDLIQETNGSWVCFVRNDSAMSTRFTDGIMRYIQHCSPKYR